MFRSFSQQPTSRLSSPHFTDEKTKAQKSHLRKTAYLAKFNTEAHKKNKWLYNLLSKLWLLYPLLKKENIIVLYIFVLKWLKLKTSKGQPSIIQEIIMRISFPKL